MIPYLRTEWGLVYIEVLCFFEASCFASDTAKGRKDLAHNIEILDCGTYLFFRGIWDIIVNGQWA